MQRSGGGWALLVAFGLWGAGLTAQAQQRCQFDQDCNDGNACTVDQCSDAGLCASTPVSCDDGDPSTIDSCDPDQGCINVRQRCRRNEDCEDQNACTTNTCVQGRCTFPAISCDDADPSTIDTCTPDQGCQHLCGDADHDGHDAATCGGDDCDDTNPAIGPGSQVCSRSGAVFVCRNGQFEPASCAANQACIAQPNGTGVCAPTCSCGQTCGHDDDDHGKKDKDDKKDDKGKKK